MTESYPVQILRKRSLNPAPKPSSAPPTAIEGLAALLLPLTGDLMVAFVPLAAALYLVTTTAWTALEHALWRRPRTVFGQR
jgi:YidC/Oxa1 family membrane protein insertase